MKLVKNWRDIACRAHSMWAFYLSVVALIAPDAIYLAVGIDTSPRLWWILALALLIYGICGRLKDQAIDTDKMQSPWAVGLVLLVAVIAIGTGDWRDRGGDVSINVPAQIASPSGMLPVPEAEFLTVAVPFVGKWEGLSLTAYRDIVGVLTVCYGETKGVRVGDSYTRAECDAMLARELLSYRRALHPAITPEARAAHLAPLRDVAFVSLAYNVGVSAASGSTAVRRLNAGDITGACEALTWWNKAGGRVIRGLVNRRTEEQALCLAGWT
ncbi:MULTISPECIES: lysozyme [unclassified Yoonia]|uniref:lysozyme n=1 Tax=unclassified Yoonia TaxID=2629118 RepID=UPI002AFDCBD0|nr:MULTISPECIES: lysozyme [unclassified Yoonia]